MCLFKVFPLSITHNSAHTRLGSAAIQQWMSVASCLMACLNPSLFEHVHVNAMQSGKVD